MFTGLISSLATVRSCADGRLVLAAADLAAQEPGASVAVNGACLTVVEHAGELVSFDLLPDTLALTNLGQLAPGSPVNLEPALRMGDPLGGHWLQGHVDAVGEVVAVEEHPTALDLELAVPEQVLRYCVDRGSIAVNGVSLTVMGLREAGVRVSLIPETRARTNLGSLASGAPVNLEADVLGKYVERLLGSRLAGSGNQ